MVKQTQKELTRKTALWHSRIHDFHMELRDQNIKHTFFNAYLEFDNISVPKEEQKDCHHQYINPYDKDFTYYYYLKNKGIKPVFKDSAHYGIDGHKIWKNLVLENLVCQYKIMNRVPTYNKTDFSNLTQPSKRSIITQVKQEFKGLRK